MAIKTKHAYITSLLKENNYVKGSVRELQILQQTRYLLTFRNTTAHRHPKFKKVHLSLDFPDLVFRWFKFTLKPPYSIGHDNLRLAIWDFLAQIWTQVTLRHILGPILVIFEICQFLMIPGPFEYFSENGWSQKIKVFSMKERSLPPYQFSFRRRGP